MARPLRAALTATGTLIGTAAFVAVLGLTTTAAGQISAAFNVLDDTQVTVTDAPPDAATASFPFDTGTEGRLDSLNGVVAAGIQWQVPQVQVSDIPQASLGDNAPMQSPAVIAASPGYLNAIGATVKDGELYGAWQQDHAQKVCLLGQGAAYVLGITSVASQRAIFIGDTPCTVIGIVGSATRNPAVLESVLIPTSTAMAVWGPPDETEEVPSIFITTRLGAAQLIARQTPYAINPYDPQRFQVTAPPSPFALGGQVGAALNGLFLALAGICLLVGAVGIANTTLVAVMERVGEIGLRRTLGARPRHIAAHFLAESGLLGLLGALLGTTVGVVIVVGISVYRQWTPIIDPATVLWTPLIGMGAGLLAGLYPALRAAHAEPARALTR
ncbi:MAG TPA: ABC transporter permease [Trebonia sp.]